jgi:5-methylcytosine-specific restriction endonuclease McrA
VSLRRASGVEVVKRGFWFLAEHRVVTSKGTLARLDAGEFRRARAAVEAGGVAELAREHDRVLWWASDGFYWSEAAMTHEEVALLLWDRQRRSEARLERLRKIRAREEQAAEAVRASIPEEVRVAVWVRDEGRCVRCGAEADLQFDHVIPVAKGGGNAVENVQVLCGDCNRLKSDGIG